jgi:VanZ family protein
VWYWGPAIGGMAAIFWASSLPTIPAVVRETSDLLLHFLAYAGLALLVIRAVASGEWHRLTHRSWWRAWLITAGYGVTDELHQWFVPGRYSSVSDWIADAIGAAVALGIVAIARRTWPQDRRNRAV